MSAIEVEVYRNGHLLRVAGELDADSVPLLRRALAEADRDVDLDMTDCTFCDSTGVIALLNAKTESNPGLTIATMSNRVERVLELCGLVDHFTGSGPDAVTA